MSNKHPRPDASPVGLPDDLDENPGIGQSKGLFARQPPDELIEGENTIEGDADNDSGLGGGIGPEEGRTNR